jgi:hypothetical protein
MAARSRIGVSRGHGWVCAFLAVSLFAPPLTAAIAGRERERPVQILALARPARTILLNLGNPRLDPARYRPVSDSVFVLPSPRVPASDHGRAARSVQSAWPQPGGPAKTQSGRSPPAIS